MSGNNEDVKVQENGRVVMAGDRRPISAWWWAVGVGVVGSIVAGVIVFMGPRRVEYSQATPEDVLASAIAMVKNDQAYRLADLMYADNVEYRSALTRLGKLLGTLQDLGQAVNERFPDDVQLARVRLKDEVSGSEATVLDLLQNDRGGGGLRFEQPRTVEERRAQEDRFKAISQRLFADPFSWLEEGAGRLSVVKVSDDTAAFQFDKQPLLGGLLTMREVDNRWWIILPLNLPGVSRYAPQTRSEWSIVASLIRVIDNALVDLTIDVRKGKARHLNQLSELAGQKAFLPTALVLVMYGKEMDIRQRRERAMGAFRKRWNEYVGTRSEDGSVRRVLSDAVGKAAIEELDGLLRKRTKDRNAVEIPKFEGMEEAQLTSLVEGWMSNQKAPISLDGVITQAQAEALVKQLDSFSKSGIRSRPAPLK